MTNRKPANILVVDDDDTIRQVLVDALESKGLKVSGAGSGREAVDRASREQPDLLIMDVRLTDGSGLEAIDKVRQVAGDVPALVITGYRDAHTLTEASRRRPVELMTKPLDIARLRSVVLEELRRRDREQRVRRRKERLIHLARRIQRAQREAQGRLDTTCVDLTSAYRALSGQLALQQAVIGYQSAMIAARNDDDVFATLFRTFALRSGAVFGIALVCDESASLRIIGRYGVPQPDGLSFCQRLAEPLVDRLLVVPRITLLDAGDEAECFHESIRRHLPGLTALSIPLIPSVGELIGAAVLYRKGEQPFTDADLALAEMASFPTATAIRRTD